MTYNRCKTCEADDLIPSDIHGDFCIYCAGDQEYYTKRKAWRKESQLTGKMTCFECGKEVRFLCNDMCTECSELWREGKLPRQL